MKTIVMVGKGGGGKTSTSINLAVCARRKGLKVGLIDADRQQSLGLWRAARGTANIPVKPCITEPQLTAAVDEGRRSSLDWLIVDMPPAFAPFTMGAVALADFTLVMMRPMMFDLAVTTKWISLLRSAARPFAVAINAAPPRRQGEEAPMVRDARQALRAIRAPVWTGQITHRLAVGYSAIGGRGVAEYDLSSPCVGEYAELWKALDNFITNPPRRLRHDSSAHAA